ncbi:hypothetical protein [Streptomyces sp. NPDC052107]|uniref:hypothetical protein n=1 Tax=Streptomyces sp. NPDC052107 TaxID=3155632 RepID=UPI003421A752
MILTPDPAWKRPLAVYARVPPIGAAEAFTDLLRTTWPAPGTLPAPPAVPARPHEGHEEGEPLDMPAAG